MRGARGAIVETPALGVWSSSDLEAFEAVVLRHPEVFSALGAALLATPAAEVIGSSVRLFDPVAYAASLLGIVTACACAALIPALRAGRIDPLAALRQD
jgi:ABC-type lipoprotein release transport system permease subunit